MASVKPGIYKVSELLEKADFDFEKEAAADYNNGAPDFRRVQVGGLPFDDLNQTVRVPVTANAVSISLDGEEKASLEVDLSDEEDQKARAYSFDTALEAEDTRK